MRQPSGQWVLRGLYPDAQARLFCFPYGGTGASALRRWPDRIGPLDVCPVQLPGRENRIRHPPFRDVGSFAAGAAEGLAEHLDRPYALFGHCQGAMLAHALTVRIEQLGLRGPDLLIVSSSRVPCLPPERRYRLPAPGRQGIYHPSLSDGQLAEELRHVSAVLGQGEMLPEMVPLAVRVLRGDLDMCFSYAPERVEAVSCPVATIGWAQDEDVAPEEMAAWREYGAGPDHVLPGGKLTFLAAPAGLLDAIGRDFAAQVHN